MTVKAILFDTRSIQRYIFSGNRLKTNIGASYIVEHIFEDVLVQDVLPTYFGEDQLDSVSWQQKTGDIGTMEKACCVAYIGGGNGLILFQSTVDTAVLRQIVTDFTSRLLVTYPGLRTGAAIGDMELEPAAAFKDSLTDMYVRLKENQNTVFPQVNVPYTGLTLACEVNGEAANFYDTAYLLAREGETRFFSQEVRAKTEAAERANDQLRRRFEKQLQGYTFPMELDRLGQRESEADMAIIHIDGNQMGKRFSKCSTLKERSELSKQVKAKTEEAFAALLETIVGEYDQYQHFLDLEAHVLPIRPLILGGDDITFICPARMALTYAKRFMLTLKELTTTEKKDGIMSCAGIAILPTAYPFFRGYELAEQLCEEAKKKSRKKDSCWLDFAILHGEQAPKLAMIREEEYMGILGNMHFGPYRVDDDTNEFSLAKLEKCAKEFQRLPRSKVKELRFVAQRGFSDCNTYLEQLAHLGLSLPQITSWNKYAASIWSTDDVPKTPYVDAVEMMEYMPLWKEEA